jgi:hypothetical protein
MLTRSLTVPSVRLTELLVLDRSEAGGQVELELGLELELHGHVEHFGGSAPMYFAVKASGKATAMTAKTARVRQKHRFFINTPPMH